MAAYERIEVILRIRNTGVVPVFYHSDPLVVRNVVKACYKGGIRVFEFTNRGDFAHEVFAEVNKYCMGSLKDIALGVGSVPDPATATLYIQLGADFVVAPTLNAETARICNRRKILWIPGCGTLSEISYAEELGAEIVKIFPGSSVGGPDFVKSIKGPMPWTSVMPAGGVSPDKENLKKWFEAGVVAVGMGSRLFTRNIIQTKAYRQLEEKVKELMYTIREVRSNL
ncbi:MAG TPA: bifunctional 4-hydroxy-2-oxoglutarate aldolase/2-dehydro-3-deoxy-phosphogluconate aldolase [Bacteroidetes bacterium]|nr:bifunctional 4-hydroxy-2-oxoglutarate aldolase/2-dehydro-3-deoxy-phosphogluconate aldolase [Bacteroidota bacterium]